MLGSYHQGCFTPGIGGIGVEPALQQQANSVGVGNRCHQGGIAVWPLAECRPEYLGLVVDKVTDHVQWCTIEQHTVQCRKLAPLLQRSGLGRKGITRLVAGKGRGQILRQLFRLLQVFHAAGKGLVQQQAGSQLRFLSGETLIGKHAAQLLLGRRKHGHDAAVALLVAKVTL